MNEGAQPSAQLTIDQLLDLAIKVGNINHRRVVTAARSNSRTDRLGCESEDLVAPSHSEESPKVRRCVFVSPDCSGERANRREVIYR